MELSEREQEVLAILPIPPVTAMARVSNVWIIEWLPSGERQTGQQLFEWMGQRRQGWAAFRHCEDKDGVLRAMAEVEKFVRRRGQVPVLHIEAHGGESGLEGPNGLGEMELLSWEELHEPLKAINIATGCNLVLYLAACLGYAGVQVFSRGPRAPAFAIIGPDRNVRPDQILEGAKEFYRRLRDGGSTLQEMLDSASNEMGDASLLYETVTELTYEAWMTQMIVSLRPVEQAARKARMRLRMQEIVNWKAEEIDSKLLGLPLLSDETELQALWNIMFMIDLFPENATRFGLDMAAARRVLMNVSQQG